MTTDIHIGKVIRKRAKELGIGPTVLAEKVNTSKQNVYGIYNRKSVDSELLYKFCVALRYDFFRHYTGLKDTGREPILFENSALIGLRKTKEDLSQTKHRLKELEERYEMLKKINKLLEEKNG